MNHITRIITRSSTISSCFRIKQQPFTTLSQTQAQPTLKLTHLNSAFDSITTIDEAVALFHLMLHMHPHPSVQDYDILFQTILRMEHYSHVIHMFKKLTLLGRRVNEYTMNTVLNCYAHLKQVESSFAVIGYFIKRGFAPDVVSFTCVVKGFFLSGRVDLGVGLFKDLVRGKVCEVDEVDEVATLTVLDGLSKAGYVGGAVELLMMMESNNWRVDVRGYNAVIDGLCKARMFKDCMVLLCRMVDRDVFPDIVSYNCLIHGLCSNGMFDYGCRVFNDLPAKGVRPSVVTYNVMMQGMLREGLFWDAKELLGKMKRVGCFPNAVTYSVIIRGCLHRLNSVDSANLLKQILEKDFQLDAPSFFLVLRKIQVLRDMKRLHDGDVYNQLIQKLISGAAIHQLRDSNDGFVINDLINKFNSFDGRYSVS